MILKFFQSDNMEIKNGKKNLKGKRILNIRWNISFMPEKIYHFITMDIDKLSIIEINAKFFVLQKNINAMLVKSI